LLQISNGLPGAGRDPLAFQVIGAQRNAVAGYKMVPGLRRDDGRINAVKAKPQAICMIEATQSATLSG